MGMPDATHTGFTDADGGGYGAGAPVSGVGWLVTGGHLDYASDLASANGGLPPLHSGRTTNEECSTEAFVRAFERFTSQNGDDLSGIGRAVKKIEGFTMKGITLHHHKNALRAYVLPKFEDQENHGNQPSRYPNLP